jgi:hypothetical protein
VAYLPINLPPETPPVIVRVVRDAVEPFLIDVHTLLRLLVPGTRRHVGCNFAIRSRTARGCPSSASVRASAFTECRVTDFASTASASNRGPARAGLRRTLNRSKRSPSARGAASHAGGGRTAADSDRRGALLGRARSDPQTVRGHRADARGREAIGGKGQAGQGVRARATRAHQHRARASTTGTGR